MDLLMFGLAALIGGLLYRLLFSTEVVGPFEQNIMKQIRAGKRVVVSVEEECFIFKMYGDRVRVTKGVATYLEEVDELESIGMASLDTNQSIDNSKASDGTV